MPKATLATWATWDAWILCMLSYRLAELWPQIWETIDRDTKVSVAYEATKSAIEICQQRMNEGAYTSYDQMKADIETETELQKMLKFL